MELFNPQPGKMGMPDANYITLNRLLQGPNAAEILMRSYMKEGAMKKPEMPSQLESMRGNYGLPPGVGNYSAYESPYSQALPEGISRAISNGVPIMGKFNYLHPADIIGDPKYSLIPR